MKLSDARLVMRKLANYEALNKHGKPADSVAWIAFHYGIDRPAAARLIHAAEVAIAKAGKVRP